MDLCGGKYISIIKMGNTPLIEVIFINHYKPYGMLHFFLTSTPRGANLWWNDAPKIMMGICEWKSIRLFITWPLSICWDTSLAVSKQELPDNRVIRSKNSYTVATDPTSKWPFDGTTFASATRSANYAQCLTPWDKRIQIGKLVLSTLIVTRHPCTLLVLFLFSRGLKRKEFQSMQSIQSANVFTVVCAIILVS